MRWGQPWLCCSGPLPGARCPWPVRVAPHRTVLQHLGEGQALTCLQRAQSIGHAQDMAVRMAPRKPGRWEGWLGKRP